ncbi:MAG: hypothetical protein EHM45_11715 [Desulfobacteraceae bacterium]|nr:MAG: hypothetical protein EHM45_11715 [Desulfobacteraceae bacterium]
MMKNKSLRSLRFTGLIGAAVFSAAAGIGAQDYFDWNARIDRHGKPSGCFEETPFPIDETADSYSIKNDEYPNGRTYYLGTKYYVDGLRPDDSGDGLSMSNAKKTIAGAIQTAGDGNKTIIVRGAHDEFDGVYREHTLWPKTGVDDAHRWMIVGYGQERPVIDAGGAMNVIVRSTGEDGPAWVTLQRLKLQNAGYELIQIGSLSSKRDGNFNWIDLWGYFGTNQRDTGRSGNFYSMGADHTWVFHCTSEHSYGHAFKIGDGAAHTLLEWSIAREFGWWPGVTSNPKTHPSGLDFPDCGKNRVVRYNIVHTGLFYAIQVRGNQSYDPDGIGLTVFHHNEIYDTTHFQDVTDELGHVTPCQVLLYNAYPGRNPSNQIYFYANIVRDGADSDCYGVYSVSDADSIHIYNNQIYNNPAGEIYVNNQLAQVLVYNNSVYHDHNTPLIRTAAGGKLVLKNNLFYQNGAAGLAQVNGDQPIHEYNLYFYPYGSFGLNGLGTGETNGHPQWLELPDGGYQANHFKLTDHLAGVDLSSLFTIDFNGADRVTWDMGAYEYVPGGPYVFVTAPVPGTVWQKGTYRVIAWIHNELTGRVKMELLKSGTSQIIAENVPIADHSYTWLIPEELASGNDYTIRISNDECADDSGVFSILAQGSPTPVEAEKGGGGGGGGGCFIATNYPTCLNGLWGLRPWLPAVIWLLSMPAITRIKRY